MRQPPNVDRLPEELDGERMGILIHPDLVHGPILCLPYGPLVQTRPKECHILSTNSESAVQIATGVALPELFVDREHTGLFGVMYFTNRAIHRIGTALFTRLLQV